MSQERWDPLRDLVALRDTMDRLFQQSPGRTSGQRTGRSDAIPLDVVDQGDAYMVRAHLPGVKTEDIQVTLQGDVLTIRGELRQENERREHNWVVREHRYGSQERSVTLPRAVRSDAATASCENGVLELRLPKQAAAPARRIPVSRGTRPEDLSSPVPNAESSATDRVTQSSSESFPASDPPSWTPETA